MGERRDGNHGWLIVLLGTWHGTSHRRCLLDAFCSVILGEMVVQQQGPLVCSSAVL